MMGTWALPAPFYSCHHHPLLHQGFCQLLPSPLPSELSGRLLLWPLRRGLCPGRCRWAASRWSRSSNCPVSPVIHRDAVSKTSLNAGLSYLRTNNFIEDSKLKLSSNRISEMQYGINHGRRVGSAFINLDLGMQEGIGALDAQGNHHPGPGEPNALPQVHRHSDMPAVQGLGRVLQFHQPDDWPTQ